MRLDARREDSGAKQCVEKNRRATPRRFAGRRLDQLAYSQRPANVREQPRFVARELEILEAEVRVLGERGVGLQLRGEKGAQSRLGARAP